MENFEIAGTLREVADLLELKGENPFRVRAYRNAARTLETLSEPVADLVEEGADLDELPAIGKDIAGYIEEMVHTGHLRRLDEARRTVPTSLTELMELEGIGPKKAMRLHEELGVRSVADLERAIDKGRVERLRGFGKRSAEKMLQSIRDFRKHHERYRLSEADQLARPLLEYLRGAPGLRELDVAGSYRRRLETIGDIDILAAADRPAAVIEHFTRYPQAARVDSAGPTRATIVLRNDLHVDLRVVRPESWGAALHYFTGSKAHNIKVRTLGIQKGLKINEYGVFQERPETGAGAGRKAKETGKARPQAARQGNRIGGEKEEDVFRAVGMQPMPPEMREDRGEVELALRGKLPTLVALDDIRGDLQVHSTWTDGRDTIEEMARAAKERGYDYIAITDHSPAVRVARGLAPRDLRRQWKEIEAMNRKVRGLTVLRGMEVDILADGSLDLADGLLEQLDVVIVAVHSRRTMPKAKMTERIVRAISHPAVHILAHPTGRIINRREPYALDTDAVLEAASEHGVAVELNAQPDRLDLSDVHAFRARELGVRIAIDTDAHATADLGAMRYGMDQARRAWLRKKDVINTMKLPQLRDWLRRRHR